MFCSDCLLDHGLRTQAARIGTVSQEACPKCGSKDGKRLTALLTADLIQQFFISASRSGRHMPPVLMLSTVRDPDLVLRPELRHDYDLLSSLVPFNLMRTAPQLIMMGLSPLRFAIEEALGIEMIDGLQLDKLFSPIIDYPVDRIWPKDAVIYRIRVNPKRPLDPSEYDSPPAQFATANRLNHQGEQIFYGAPNVETCAFEVKPSLNEMVNEEMFVATFRLTRSIKLFDFINYPFDADVASNPGEIYFFLKSLFFPADGDYRITQELACRIKASNLEGVLYPSAYSYIRDASGYPNVALFGTPLRAGLLELVSINKVYFRSVSYGCELGAAFE
jgi:hypothetical protein